MTISTDDHKLLPVGGARRITADFAGDLPASSPATTLVSVAWSITPRSGSPLTPTLSDQTDALSASQSNIVVTGGAHGVTYVLQAAGTLSDGQVVVKDIALQGFDG